jgi:methionyl-tRNA formyltransferase
MGTPDFAVPSLMRLARAHRVVGVVTRPDRPKGRGRQIGAPPVKLEAVRLGLEIAQPDDLKSPDFLSVLERWKADCFAVVGFRILPPDVYGMPLLGAVNLHASLLPKYRGAAPIQWAIMRGETQTGLTTFFLKPEVDTGDVILQETVSIGESETMGDLQIRMADIGAELLVRTLDLIERGEAKPIRQKGETTPAPKLTPEIGAIHWNRPAPEIVNQIRGLSPAPGAYTIWDGLRLKILRASVAEDRAEKRHPGDVLTDNDLLFIRTGRGLVRILEVQPECKKAMTAAAFIRGRRPPLQVGE